MRIFENIYRLLYIVLGIGALIVATGITSTGFRPYEFVYYTNLSNLICVIYFSLKVIYSNKAVVNTNFGKFIQSPHIKFSITMCILLTGLIYHFLLMPPNERSLNDILHINTNSIILHYIIPAMTFLDWLFFDKKGQNKWYYPITWIIVPYAYFLFILLRAPLFGNIGKTSDIYPYDFINVDLLGIQQVAINVLIITTVFILLSYLLFLLDFLLYKIQQKLSN